MGLRWPITPRCTCTRRAVVNGTRWAYNAALGWHAPEAGHLIENPIPFQPVRLP